MDLNNRQFLLWLLFIFKFSILFNINIIAGEVAPKYNIGDLVPVSVNTVGPYRNPNEKYPFYDKVPFCKPKNVINDIDAGSVFMGDRAKLSDYILPFRENIHEPKEICNFKLDQNAIKKYIEIIRENYMFEFFIDHNLLITGFLGKEEVILNTNEKYYYLFTHWNFHCEYNEHYVISCRITTDLDKQILLKYGEDIDVLFTYNLIWESCSISVYDRLMYHVRRLISNQPLEVHWLSTLNSFILVILVTAFITLVFTTILRQDCARYHELLINDVDDTGVSDPGWKQLQRDIFRSPSYILLFSSIIGCGTQLLVLMISLLLLSLIGLFYPGNRGSIVLSIIFVYCFTSGISGHISSSLYKQLGGNRWANNSILTACIFIIPFGIIFIIINSCAIYYKSSIALPAVNILLIFFLWLLFILPLTIYASRRVKNNENIKSGTLYDGVISKVPREIPKLSWYKSSYIQIIFAGILPFTSIYIELHFLFMAIFGHQVYTLFGILSLAFLMLLIVTCAVTIGLTYFQLQNEDWRWWWTSFATAGSTGIYIFAYSIFYYIYRSYMTGILQATIFFGYITVVSYAFFLMLGATGWWATFLFLKQIYGAIKSD